MDARWKQPVRPCCVFRLRITATGKAQQGLTLPHCLHTPSLPMLQPHWPLSNPRNKPNSAPPLSIFLFPVPGMAFLQVPEGLSPSLLPGISAEGSPLKGSCGQLYLKESSSWDIVCQVLHLFPLLYVTRWNCLVSFLIVCLSL